MSAELGSVLTEFVSRCEQPVLIDAGEEPLELRPDCWSVTDWNGRAVVQAWDDRRNLVRKVTAIKEQLRHRLVLVTERFPRATGEMQICDLAAPGGRDVERRSSRIAFRERFRLMLARQFPSWEVEDLSSEPNLEHSLPPTFVRGFLRMGSMGIAVMAVPPDCADVAGVVAFGLIWLDYLRKREPALSVRKLLYFVEHRSEGAVLQRVRWIREDAVTCETFLFDARDRVCRVEDSLEGNRGLALARCHRPTVPNQEISRLPHMLGVDAVEQSDGSVRFQVRGLEFARWNAGGNGGKFSCGIGKRRRASVETVIATARELLRVRTPDTEDRQHPLYTQQAEGWMEAQVRRDPQAIDATLHAAPIYGQVPFSAGLERSVADLLAVDMDGRLAVIEMKATAEIQLPFQALDYWAAVRMHLQAGDFERLGYFAGVRLLRELPRVLLVAPALEFHSTSETILSYLDPAIEFTRIGLAADWRNSLRVMFRLRGAEKPGVSAFEAGSG